MAYKDWIMILGLLICFLYSISRLRTWKRYGPLPPGPKRLPVVGNALQVPLSYMERTFASLSRQYGDLMYLEFFGRPTVVINSQRIARELLHKRGAKYSDRPRMVTMVEMLGWDPTVSLQRYGPSMIKQRKWIHGVFGEESALKSLDVIQRRETYVLLTGLMATPAEFVLHIKRHISAMVLESIYGHRITSLEDEYVTLMSRAMQATGATGVAGATPPDILPILKYTPAWLPGIAFKRMALHARKLVLEGHYMPYRMTRQAMASGTVRPCFTSTRVEEAERSGQLHEEEAEIIFSAGAIYGGATDTTRTVLLTFILAMVLHPDVYAKAQEEMDRVIGDARLPTLEDRPRLPYINSVLSETYRWHAPVPLGIPHCTTEDDHYNRFYIPKGAVVVANLWQMCRDERVWEDPALFQPERFLKPGRSQPESETLDPRNIVFGYGRRICPGRHFADTTLFLTIANMAATLNIRKARDADGVEVTPRNSFTDSLVSYPEDFVCSITPRSSAAESLVAETLASLPE